MTILNMIRDNAPKEGPKYPHLETLFRKAIENGTLQPGDKLPPLRQAAWEASCSLGTLARVYSALERQGLVKSEVGRGTFVKEPDSLTVNTILPRGAGSARDLTLINLVQNEIFHEDAENLARQAMNLACQKIPSVHITGYGDGNSHPDYKSQIAKLLPRGLQSRDSNDLVVTHGVQHGLFTILSRLAGQGDGVAVEPIAYPGVKAIVSQHGLNLSSVEMDELGIISASLDRLCADGRIRILLTTPTGQNPTCLTSPIERRREICEIARKHDLLIVEDDIYGHLYPDSPPTYAELLPDQTIYLNGLSKRVAPALRVGLAVVPARYALLLAQAITTQSWMVSPLLVGAMAEIADRRSQLDRMAQDNIQRSRERVAMLQQKLTGLVSMISTCRPHAWIKLPEGMTDDMLVPVARQLGVSVTEGHRFSNKLIADHSHIRIALLSCPTDEIFATGLDRLALALEQVRSDNVATADLSFV